MTQFNTYKLLFVLKGANLQSTSDQSFTKIGIFTDYIIKDIIGKTMSGGATGSIAGGIYTAATKGGTQLVASTQSWTGLSATGTIELATLASVNTTNFQTATPILSLTTGSTAAATADFFIFGVPLD